MSRAHRNGLFIVHFLSNFILTFVHYSLKGPYSGDCTYYGSQIKLDFNFTALFYFYKLWSVITPEMYTKVCILEGSGMWVFALELLGMWWRAGVIKRLKSEGLDQWVIDLSGGGWPQWVLDLSGVSLWVSVDPVIRMSGRKYSVIAKTKCVVNKVRRINGVLYKVVLHWGRIGHSYKTKTDSSVKRTNAAWSVSLEMNTYEHCPELTQWTELGRPVQSLRCRGGSES